MAFFELAVFASALTGTELAKACVAGLVGNRVDAGAIKFAEDAVRRLAANTPPENHHVLKAMHIAFVGSLEQMVRACDSVGGSAEDNFSRKALQAFVKSPKLRKLDTTEPVLPVAELEAQVAAIYGQQDAGPRTRSCDYVLALVMHHTANALSQAHRDVFHHGHGRFLGWADYFDVFFAAQIKKNDDARRILMLERANELVRLAGEQAELLEDFRDLLEGIADEIDALREENIAEHRRTQDLIRREKHELAIAEILNGTAEAALLERYENALNIRRQDGSHVSATEAANFALAGERAAQSEDPRVREIATLLDQGRIVEASDRKAELAEETVMTAARELRDAAYLALPVSPSKAIEHLKRATELDPTDFWSWIELGRLRAQYDGLAAARDCFNAGLQQAIDERERMVLHNEFGNLLATEGQLGAARDEYESALAIAGRLAVVEPGNAEWRSDLSISYMKIGDIEVATGNLGAARTRFEEGLVIREHLADAEPANAQWQRDLALSYNKLGDVEVATGNLGAARSRFEQGLAIRKRLVDAKAGNTEWQRDLSLSYDNLGRVEVEAGNLNAARTLIELALAIRERLTEAEPGNAEWLRDLSVSYHKLGDVEAMAGNLAAARSRFEQDLAIAKHLAGTEPRNAEWQRDLSVSYNKLGKVEATAGNIDSARALIQHGLTIRKRLAEVEPNNAGWQRDLSVSYGQLGEIEVAAGNLSAARTSFEQGLSVFERLAEAEPGNADWQRDLVVSNYKLGQLAETEGNPAGALSHYRAAEKVMAALVAKCPDHPGFARDLALVQQAIARLDGGGEG